MNIGQKIVSLRGAKGIKQNEISDKLQIDRSYYSRLEKDADTKMSIEQLKKVAEVLGVTIEYLINYDPAKPMTPEAVLMGRARQKDEIEAENERLKEKVANLSATIELQNKYIKLLEEKLNV